MKPEDQERYWAEQTMRVKLGSAYNHRRQPRVRLRKGRPGYWQVLAVRRTKRAAFRAARELRGSGFKMPLVVFALPMEKGRKTVDWAVGRKRSSMASRG